MALYQPTNISPSSLNGTGVIDATKDLTVSWQINGYGGMIGWQIKIMRNDAESTLVYDSTMLHSEHYSPDTGDVGYVYIYGKNENGDDVPFSWTIPAADLAGKVVNGYENGYKLRINQQYTDESGEKVTVVQNSPVFFMAQAAWNWTYSWSATQTMREPLFQAFYPMNSPAQWHRWRLAGASTDNILYDSGRIYSDNNPNYRPENLVDGHTYHIRLDGQNTSGATADTGWFQFTVNYTLNTNAHIRCKAYYVSGMPCVYVALEADANDAVTRGGLFPYYGWDVYRVKTGSDLMEHAAVIPNGQYSFYDFGIKNNTEYTYEIFSNFIGNGAYHYTSNAVKMSNYWNWSLVETVPKTDMLNHAYDRYASWDNNTSNIMYHVVRVFQFQGNVKSGNVSNDNSPFVGENFTGYPIVQKSSRRGLSGTLKGMTGIVKNAAYSDSIDTNDAIQAMSSSETVKFLRDRKGNFRRVEIDGPIVKNTSDENAEQAVEIQIPWVETGNADGCQVVSTVDDGLLMYANDFKTVAPPSEYLISANLSAGEYKWTASGIGSGSVQLSKIIGMTETTVGSISAGSLTGTFTLESVGSLYATGSAANITVNGFLLQKTGEYEEEVTPTPGEITIDANGYGTQIAILEPGATYDWEYTSADIETGATVKLRLVQQTGSTVTQTDKAVFDDGPLSGTFSTVGDADSATLWLVTSTADPVEVDGWSLTKTGGGGGDQPQVRSSDTVYLLAGNLSAGTWQYTLNGVTYTNPITGRVLTVADGTTVNTFDIGNTASGSFTATEPVNLYIYNPNGTEFTIMSYTLVQTAQPEDPDTGIVYQNNLTVQGNVLVSNYTVPTIASSTMELKATGITAPNAAYGLDANTKVVWRYKKQNGDKYGYTKDKSELLSGFYPSLSGVIDYVSLELSFPQTPPPVTITGLTFKNYSTGTTLYSAESLTLNYASLINTTLAAGSYSVYGTSITGTANVTFFCQAGNMYSDSKTVTLNSSNITTTQTITVSSTLNAIYVTCPYEDEVTITGLTIIKND